MYSRLMTKSNQFQFRVDSQVKSDAFKVLDKINMTPSQACNILFEEIVRTNDFPFKND